MRKTNVEFLQGKLTQAFRKFNGFQETFVASWGDYVRRGLSKSSKPFSLI